MFYVRIGIRLDKAERRGVVGPAPQGSYGFIGYHASRADSNIRHENAGDGGETENRNIAIGLQVSAEKEKSGTARILFALDGDQFVLEVPVENGKTNGFARFRLKGGHILYRVLSEGEQPRALIDRFATFVRELTPSDDHPDPSDAAAQIDHVNESDPWKLTYPYPDAPSKEPKLRAGIRV
jgi:hypothetical protein